jgi:hypothetical protein
MAPIRRNTSANLLCRQTPSFSFVILAPLVHACANLPGQVLRHRLSPDAGGLAIVPYLIDQRTKLGSNVIKAFSHIEISFVE